MLLFESIIILFASLSAIRSLTYIEQQNMFTESELTKIGTTLLVLIFLIVKIPSQSSVSAVFTGFAPIALMLFLPKILLVNRELRFEKDFRISLQQMLLSMRSGQSFRAALTQCLQQEKSPHHKKIMVQVADLVVFTQHRVGSFPFKTLKRVVLELKKADSDPHLSLSRLENLEMWLRIRSDFRRRSGKVLTQIRIQAAVTLILYFAVSVFMSLTYGFHSFQNLFFISACLMGVGTLVIFISGRRLKWRL